MPATMPPCELHEVSDELVCEVLPTGGCPDGDRMHISNRLGLREKAKQVSDYLGSSTNDERRVSKLVN
jgi:hypothetical protein